MNTVNKIEINAAIFPRIMSLALGKPIKRNADDDTSIAPFESTTPDIEIDLPRGAYLLYLQSIVSDRNELEMHLLKQYAYGISFSDEDYISLLDIIMTPINRSWTQTIQQGDVLSPFGIDVSRDEIGNQKFVLIEDAVPSIRVETWECIIIDILKKAAFDIINCFDFGATFTRRSNNSADNEKLMFSLGAWKFSSDNEEQSLSNALRSAFMFTLVGYYFGDLKDHYQCFQDFFDAEFFKRVSLVYGMWSGRSTSGTISYVPLYESFHNLDGMETQKLINVIKTILDNDSIAIDEKQTLKNRLIEGAGTFHNNIDTSDIVLEQSLIKPAVNFILLREKAKDTLSSAQILCEEGKYLDCAGRCYYAMMFALKALMENKGKLASWKENELKEKETHDSLDKGLKELVAEGILTEGDESTFEYVKDQRWKCDYSLYKFEKTDAEGCVKKAKDFFEKIESIIV